MTDPREAVSAEWEGPRSSSRVGRSRHGEQKVTAAVCVITSYLQEFVWVELRFLQAINALCCAKETCWPSDESKFWCCHLA